MDVTALRREAREVFAAGVEAADPARAVHAALEREPVTATRVIAFGKAALPMASAALKHLPPVPCLIVTNRENARTDPPANAKLLVAGHPVPDADGAEAARAVEAFAAEAGEGETVLVLVSGGGSAMLPAPVEGLTLGDKIATTEALLASGAPIDAVNAVRRALSRLKGGGLARAILPARTVALLLSDVPRDDIAAIASGPTVPTATPSKAAIAALAVLERYGVTEGVPACVRSVLVAMAEGASDQVTATCLSGPIVENRLVGGNGVSLDAAQRLAMKRGMHTAIVSRWLDGDVSEAAAMLHRSAVEAASRVDPPSGTHALLAGGETTVVLRGRGKGGRNQELALRVAMLAEAEPIPGRWAFLSGGTDGRDGPTDAAGGLVDAGTVARIRAAGLDPEALLADNDAYRALAASHDLLMTGGTGTNVADLQVLLLEGAR